MRFYTIVNVIFFHILVTRMKTLYRNVTSGFGNCTDNDNSLIVFMIIIYNALSCTSVSVAPQCKQRVLVMFPLLLKPLIL